MKFRPLVFILLLGLLANSFGQEIKGKDDDDSEKSEGQQKGSYKMTPGLLMEPYRNKGQTVGGSSQTNSELGGKYQITF